MIEQNPHIAANDSPQVHCLKIEPRTCGNEHEFVLAGSQYFPAWQQFNFISNNFPLVQIVQINLVQEPLPNDDAATCIYLFYAGTQIMADFLKEQLFKTQKMAGL